MEYLIGLVTVLLLFGFLPYQAFKTFREKSKYKESSGDTLRRSELEQMIREAAEEAVEPLRKRVETLEAISTDPDEELEGRVDPNLLLEDSEHLASDREVLETHQVESERTRA